MVAGNLALIICPWAWSKTWYKICTTVSHNIGTYPQSNILSLLELAYVLQIVKITRGLLNNQYVLICYIKFDRSKRLSVPLFVVVASDDNKLVDNIKRITKHRPLILVLISSMRSGVLFPFAPTPLYSVFFTIY